MLRVIATTVLCCISPLIYAGCEEFPAQVNAKIGYPSHETEVYFAACKVWPADSSQAVVALAHFQKGSSFSNPPDSNGLYDLDIVIVNTETGEFRQRLFQKGAVASDAIYFSGMDIDTARYQLAPGIVAFGLRANRSGPADIETLNLYVVHENELKLILSKLNTVERFAEQQVECPHASDTYRTLAVATKANQGAYADLIVQEKTTTMQPMPNNDECTTKEIKTSAQYSLRFDGNIYVLPQELQSDY